MKKIILVVLFTVIITNILQAQQYEKPTYSEIEKEINDFKSNFYYSKLIERFNSVDSTLTLSEKRHLYYGFTFQKGYSYKYKSKELSDLNEIIKKGDPQENDFPKVMTDCEAILKQNPFDLRAMNYKRFVFEKKGEARNSKKQLAQIKMVLSTIISSGDGLSKENPFYVIDSAHCYDLLALLGYKYEGNEKPIENSLHIKIKENDKKIEGFYFDLTPSLKAFNAILSAKAIDKNFMVGTWKIVDVLDSNDNKKLTSLVNGFKKSSMTFNSDMSFQFKSTDTSKGILEFLRIMGNSNYTINANDNSISIGTPKDNYSLLKFKVIKKPKMTFFAIDENGTQLTFIVEKQ